VKGHDLLLIVVYSDVKRESSDVSGEKEALVNASSLKNFTLLIIYVPFKF